MPVRTRCVHVLRLAALLVLALLVACDSDSGGDVDVDVDSDGLLAETAFDPHWGVVGVFSDAASCTECHRTTAQTPDVMTYDGRDVSPKYGWENSIMALAFADPYFQAAVAEEVAQFPHLAGFIEDTCLTCHSPMARTHARQTGEGLDEDGYYRFATALGHMHAREGVSCTACHQIQSSDDGSFGTPSSFSGGFVIDALTAAPLIYGPYDNPVTGAMRNNTQYDPSYGPHMSDAGHCATCHTLFTPTLDLAGQPTGASFAEQSPYQEWQNSVYAPGGSKPRTCQTCHMPVPATGYGTRIAITANGNDNTGWPTRTPFHTHGFVGGNSHTLEVMLAFRNLLGIEDYTSTEGLDAQIAATRTLLANRSANVAIEAVNNAGGTLEIPVRITNRTGHKLPTSYPSRRVWVHLKVTDAGGAVVFESGLPDARGHISTDAAALQHDCVSGGKVAGFDYGSCFEPHRDVIADPAQVAIYESVLGDVEGDNTYVLLHAAAYLKDNRLPPEGFINSATPGTAEGLPVENVGEIVGVDATDTDFNGGPDGGTGQDVVHYQVDVGAHTAPFTIAAELLYQSVRPGFIVGLHHDEEPRIARYKEMVEVIPPTVETLAAASLTTP